MKPSTVAVFGLLMAVGVCSIAPACSSGGRPIGTIDGGGGDGGTTGAAGTTATAGAAGTGAAGTGAAGTTGAAGSGATAGTSGAAGTSGRGGTVGTAGTTGVAGRGGTTGTAGTTGAAGRGGTTGTAGGAGTSPAAGRGGSGGAGPGPECATAADCKLVSDCCTCAAIPAGNAAPSCAMVCIQSMCAARQLPQGMVACVAGKCVAGFDCDTTKVTCRRAAPTCPAGEVPSVDDAGTCYTGACAPATECTTVAGCASCAGPDQACVTYETQVGPQHHCVTVPPECGGNANCSCMGAGSCVAPYRSCSNFSGLRGISCGCPNC